MPSIAAIAGASNPLAALAVYTLMKVLPDVNENLISYEYQITGPWKTPTIKLVGAQQESIDNNQSEPSILNMQ